jgi:type VI secretion system protein ImpH
MVADPLARPDQEVARFGASSSLAFPEGEVARLDPPSGDVPARVVVSFMGLTGPQAVLPIEYTCLVADRARRGDTVLRDFLDIFHHRMLALFYRAWEKSHFFAAQERGADDRLAEYVAALCGLGPAEARAALPADHRSLLFYTGLLAPQQRSAAALEQLIGDYFDVQASVEQFTGGWYAIDARTQCAVGEERGESEQLGLGAVIGDAVYDPQAAARIRLGPLSRDRYDEFLPGGTSRRELRELVRLFVGDTLDVELQLVLNADEVPPCRLGEPPDAPLALGWYTWLGTSSQRPRDPDDTILTL